MQHSQEDHTKSHHIMGGFENNGSKTDVLDTEASTKQDETESEKGTYFDDAIGLCGYGKFHIFLFVATVFGQIGNVMATALSAYLLANIECDLSVSLANKGILNAIPFAGMITSGIFTGFLTDTLGRKFFLVWGYLCMGLVLLAQATSQTFTVLLVLKFLEGVVFTGPFTSNITYLGEMHDNKLRSRVLLFAFCFIGFANTVIPLIGWAILPYDWAIVVVEDTFIFRSWHLFLAVNSLWSLIACAMYAFLPESAKFDLAHSKHDEALSTLKKMYAYNTSNPPETYPVKKVYLLNTVEKTEGFKRSLESGLKNIRPLLSKPYITTLILVCCMQFCIMLSFNTFRLWYPQLATIFENYALVHNETGEVCVMLNDYLDQKAETALLITEATECITVRSGAETYINSAILGAASIIPYVVAGFLIDRLGKRLLIFITMGVCGILAATLYLSVNAAMIVGYFAVFIPLSQTTVSLMLTVTVDAFPTAFRALTLSLLMAIGRTGALLGNISFPYMLESGCLVPFIVVACLCFFAAFLGTIIPQAKKK